MRQQGEWGMVNKIVNKYKQMSLPAKAAIWFTICNFVLKGISFISGPIFTRVLSTDEYGLQHTLKGFSNIEMMLIYIRHRLRHW